MTTTKETKVRCAHCRVALNTKNPSVKPFTHGILKGDYFCGRDCAKAAKTELIALAWAFDKQNHKGG